jgi:hypothetical protein
LWDWAKDLQLKPEELRIEVLLSKEGDNKSAWHRAAAWGNVEVLQKLCDWAKELQLKPEELINEVFLSKICIMDRPGTRQQEEATLKLRETVGLG